MTLTKNAEKIFKLKYAIGDETWEKACTRVASYIAGAEKEDKQVEYTKKFYELIYNKVFTEVFGEDYGQRGDISEIYNNYTRWLESQVFIDDHSGNIDYYLNFGETNTFAVTNWTRDNIKYPDVYSIVFKLYKPLPREIKEKDQLWISRLVTRPIIETVFLFGQKDEKEFGVQLNLPNFDIEIAWSNDYDIWAVKENDIIKY